MTFQGEKTNTFQHQLLTELNTFLNAQRSAFPVEEILKIDLHCHDHNSDVPDENRPKSRRITQLLRKLLDEYEDRMCVGEIYALPPGDPATAADYLGSGNDSVHLAFDFSLIFQFWNARKFYTCLKNTVKIPGC